MLKANKSAEIILRLPKIDSKFAPKSVVQDKRNNETQILDQGQDDSMQVSKLQQWSMNKPTKKARTMINSHNISFLYRSSTVRKQKPGQFGNNYKFMDVQLFIAKVDSELQKIGQTNYFSIYKNLQYCSGVYQNSFNALLKTIAKHRSNVQAELDQIQLKLQIQREEHIKKVHQLQKNQNQSYKGHINEVRQILEEKQKQIKPLKKMLQKIDSIRTKVLKYCLSLGYDVREQGLIWILKQLRTIPKPQEFPSFLSKKQVNFIITKYTNEYEVSNVQNLMKAQICGKSINEAYEYVNRRKRRQLSFIKENQELVKLYTNRIKDYNREKHNYLSDSTLQIAQKIEKQKPKPTRYEIIYKQTTKKLNKICRQKIHPQIYVKANKENKKSSGQETKDVQIVRRKQKKKSTIIIEQFSKILNLSINQSKKLDELYTKQQKQFEQILREIRHQKYTQSASHRISMNKFDQNSEQDKLRNPISILGCLVGWKKAQKIIEQQMLGL